ncbi:MAG: hypothetical protein WD848_13570 [Dehalococcoidia bacterium]
MEIIDANINDLRKSSQNGRTRSPETIKMMEAIESLASGKAKAIIPEGDESIRRLRVRLGYAARAVGVKLRTVSDDKRVMFTLRGGATSAAVKPGGAERRELVRSKALQMARAGKTVLTADDVLKALQADGAVLDAARPTTAVGAVLRSMPEFGRAGKNTFSYQG